MKRLLVGKPNSLILSYFKLCKQQSSCVSIHLNQAQFQSNLLMKPLRTYNAAESRLTTPKSAFGKPISQCGLSTKSLKPRRTYHTRENVISARKPAFEAANSPSKVSAKNSRSANRKATAPKNK
ncbi:hypothetical protein [Vibrio cidicii]|uniref:hypothetical protein n=1 Tax=Vibrio cidicii TaxID=1763883 RepID=UPI0018C339AF|nr:hypothetical protein [Vibrio cidicii]